MIIKRFPRNTYRSKIIAYFVIDGKLWVAWLKDENSGSYDCKRLGG